MVCNKKVPVAHMFCTRAPGPTVGPLAFRLVLRGGAPQDPAQRRVEVQELKHPFVARLLHRVGEHGEHRVHEDGHLWKKKLIHQVTDSKCRKQKWVTKAGPEARTSTKVDERDTTRCFGSDHSSPGGKHRDNPNVQSTHAKHNNPSSRPYTEVHVGDAEVGGGGPGHPRGNGRDTGREKKGPRPGHQSGHRRGHPGGGKSSNNKRRNKTRVRHKTPPPGRTRSQHRARDAALSTVRHGTARQDTKRDKTRLHKTRRDKTRQDQTRQDKTRRDKTRQDKTRQDNTRRGKTRYKTRQDTTRCDKTRHDKTRTVQDKTIHDTKPHDTTRHGTARHETTRLDTTRHDTTRYDTTRHDTTRRDTTRHIMAPHDRAHDAPVGFLPQTPDINIYVYIRMFF